MVKCIKLIGIFISLMSYAYATDFKIAVVNTDRILRESAPAVRAGKKLESEFAPRKEKLIKLSSQLRHLQQQLEKGKLDEAARSKTEQALLQLEQDFQRIQLEFNKDMTTRSNEELSTLNTIVTKAIQQLAEKENIDLVLQEAVYRSKRIDITDQALKYLSDK
jgi:outer membrane protein